MVGIEQSKADIFFGLGNWVNGNLLKQEIHKKEGFVEKKTKGSTGESNGLSCYDRQSFCRADL